MKRLTIMKYIIIIFSTCILAVQLFICREQPVQFISQVLQEPLHITQADVDYFISHYPKYKKIKNSLTSLYSKDSSFIWYDSNGLKDFARVVYNNAGQLEKEGLPAAFPYAEKYASIFEGSETAESTPENELLISALYLYYNNKVYGGLGIDDSRRTGWLLPREKVCLTDYRDSVITDKPHKLFSQYANLKKALERYLAIEKSGGWDSIEIRKEELPLYPGDTSATIGRIRKRLYTEGYLINNSGSSMYDNELKQAVEKYLEKQYKNSDSLITSDFIADLNISITERIKCIAVNMERCRWIPAETNRSAEFIAVNIPSFRMHYIKNGKPVLVSKVVVGKEATKTVVFSGELSYIVFSPYWNVPGSILQKEILPEVRRNPNYLAEHDMEWVGNKVRQRPGPKNPLGLVKFMFPNSNSIYLHDTPSKSLFNKDERAFSHGCIRLERARELAIAITGNDGNWTADKVDAAMNAGKESTYVLKKRIPIYIAYFTAWADGNGNVAFFEDIYARDSKLAALLFEE
jgi:murein L,D-transpeptidase YcbB/YkuD